MIRWKGRPELYIIEAEEGGRTNGSHEKRNGSGTCNGRSTVPSTALCAGCHFESVYFFKALLFPIKK